MATATVARGGWWWGGHRYSAGERVDAPAAQIAAWQAGGYVSTGETPAPAKADVLTAGAAGAPPEAREWPHKITPKKYIDRFPDGPAADLARAILGNDGE